MIKLGIALENPRKLERISSSTVLFFFSSCFTSCSSMISVVVSKTISSILAFRSL